MGRINDTLKASTAAANDAKKQLDSAAQLVERCKDNIAFISKMKKLREELSQKQNLIGEKQVGVDQAKQKLADAESRVEEANQQKAAIERQAAEIKQRMMQLRGAKK